MPLTETLSLEGATTGLSDESIALGVSTTGSAEGSTTAAATSIGTEAWRSVKASAAATVR